VRRGLLRRRGRRRGEGGLGGGGALGFNIHEVVLRLARDGVTTCVEVGPGKVLSGLVKRIAPEIESFNVEDRASLERTVAALKG